MGGDGDGVTHGVMKMQTAVVAALNHGGKGSGKVYRKPSICFHHTVSEQSMPICSVSATTHFSSTLTKSQLPKLSLVPIPHQLKSTTATVGYEVIFLCSGLGRWKPVLFDHTLVLPLLAVCLWAGYLTLSFVSPVYGLGFNSIYF